MDQTQFESAENLNIPISHQDLLKKIIYEIDQSIKGKRNIMYSDIIILLLERITEEKGSMRSFYGVTIK